MKDLNGYLFDGTIDLEEISGICERCGKSIRYGIWLKHYLTNDRILVGRECSDKQGIHCNNCGSIIHKVIKTPTGKYCCTICNAIINPKGEGK